jgi:hypothetical protein
MHSINQEREHIWERQELSAEMKTNLIGFPTKPHEEIIRLYITVKKALLMHVLNSVNLQ